MRDPAWLMDHFRTPRSRVPDSNMPAFALPGLALSYYFISRASNSPLYGHKLSMIGFWSLAFVYVWTGAHHMIHGPISQWLQTISIVFSMMLLIPVWAVVYNFIATMKGQWHQLGDNVSLKFLMSGTVFYLLTCFQGPMHLRVQEVRARGIAERSWRN